MRKLGITFLPAAKGWRLLTVDSTWGTRIGTFGKTKTWIGLSLLLVSGPLQLQSEYSIQYMLER